MLTEIKIMLGLGDDQNKEHKNNYDSFVNDTKTSENKSAPSLDDHNLLGKVAQLLRHGYVNEENPEDPRSEGFIEKIRRLMGKHE